MIKRPGALITQSSYKVLFRVKSAKLKHDWSLPQGYDTGIKIWCKQVKKKVPLMLPNKHLVKWYICGPTVYDVSHVGHASCYIRFDIINRILREFFDIKPIIGLGITDIDDKIIIQAFNKKIGFKELAKKYELEFLDEINELNILPPTFLLRVTEHIPEIIDFISKIIDKGDAYAVEDGSVYFNVPEKDQEPPPIKPSLKPGQKHYSHFALWKGAKPEEPHWDSPWGKGRPGWHIECSAMASKVFGSNLDLHGGGLDLFFPHHTCEEIQSCSYHSCKQWVNYWVYTGELQVKEEKMSKSLQNYTSIKDFLKSYTPDNLRMLCFISKYNRPLYSDPNAMILPVSSCKSVAKFLADSNAYVKGNWSLGNISEPELLQNLENTKKNVREHLKNDFDTGHCHLELMELISKTVSSLCENPKPDSCRCPVAVQTVHEYIRDTFRAFGFQLGASEMTSDSGKLEFVINEAVDFRRRVRMEALQCKEKSTKGNLLKLCDSLRQELNTVGIIIKDQDKDKSAWSFLEMEKSAAESG